ncbi:hypothetical protein HK102_010529, partial [Quaeritorhiza haematococci]
PPPLQDHHYNFESDDEYEVEESLDEILDDYGATAVPPSTGAPGASYTNGGTNGSESGYLSSSENTIASSTPNTVIEYDYPSSEYSTSQQSYASTVTPAGGNGAAGGFSHQSLMTDIVDDLKRKANEAMRVYKNLIPDPRGVFPPGWKVVIRHKSGAVVYRRTKGGKSESGGKDVPIFMGVGVVKGYSPEEVFGLIENRQSWDEWYQEGHLVETIDENTSVGYMAMKAVSEVVASQRDFSLLQHKEYDPVNKTIHYITTSVDIPQVPRSPGRVRANLQLNGWTLEPRSFEGIPCTKLTYVLQTDVKGLLPPVLVKRWLTRRALIVTRMGSYLKKNGPPGIPPERMSFMNVDANARVETLDLGMDAFPTPPTTPGRSATITAARSVAPSTTESRHSEETIRGPAAVTATATETFVLPPIESVSDLSSPIRLVAGDQNLEMGIPVTSGFTNGATIPPPPPPTSAPTGPLPTVPASVPVAPP